MDHQEGWWDGVYLAKNSAVFSFRHGSSEDKIDFIMVITLLIVLKIRHVILSMPNIRDHIAGTFIVFGVTTRYV